MRIDAEAQALNQDRAQDGRSRAVARGAPCADGRRRMLFDTHVNLHAEQFAGDLPDVIARARAAGVTRLVTICDRLDRYPRSRSSPRPTTTSRAPSACIRTTPKDYWSLEATTLVEEARASEGCRIGETGLDQHYGYSDIVLQERSFVEHIHAARETGLAAGRAHARGR